MAQTKKMILTDITSGVSMTTPEPAVRHVRVLLSPLLQEGLEDFSLGYTEVPPGQQGSKHKHPDAAEVWLFFAGQGRAIVGDEEIETGPGTVVYTPPDTFHHFFNTGDQPVKLYYVFVPSGPEKTVMDQKFR